MHTLITEEVFKAGKIMVATIRYINQGLQTIPETEDNNKKTIITDPIVITNLRVSQIQTEVAVISKHPEHLLQDQVVQFHRAEVVEVVEEEEAVVAEVVDEAAEVVEVIVAVEVVTAVVVEDTNKVFNSEI
jgi:hypothetical protein